MPPIKAMATGLCTAAGLILATGTAAAAVQSPEPEEGAPQSGHTVIVVRAAESADPASATLPEELGAEDAEPAEEAPEQAENLQTVQVRVLGEVPMENTEEGRMILLEVVEEAEEAEGTEATGGEPEEAEAEDAADSR